MLGTLGQLAQRVGGRAVGDATFAVARIAAIDEAVADSLTFATTAAYLESALKSRAGAILVEEELLQRQKAPYCKPLIAVANVRLELATTLQAFERTRKARPFRDPSAGVDPTPGTGPDAD